MPRSLMVSLSRSIVAALTVLKKIFAIVDLDAHPIALLESCYQKHKR